MDGVTVEATDVAVMLQLLPLPEWLRVRLESAPPEGRLHLTGDEAYALHELCAEELVRSGFDGAYELTEVGEMLDWLLDKLWE